MVPIKPAALAAEGLQIENSALIFYQKRRASRTFDPDSAAALCSACLRLSRPHASKAVCLLRSHFTPFNDEIISFALTYFKSRSD